MLIHQPSKIKAKMVFWSAIFYFAMLSTTIYSLLFDLASISVLTGTVAIIAAQEHNYWRAIARHYEKATRN